MIYVSSITKIDRSVTAKPMRNNFMFARRHGKDLPCGNWLAK
jgi:hypothetical protein